ncbi:MAG: hypothetical protein ACLRWQ_20240 [Flavonifractor plautii]
MNPILLKPTSNMGSQVIVNGEVLGNMPAVDYLPAETGAHPCGDSRPMSPWQPESRHHRSWRGRAARRRST